MTNAAARTVRNRPHAIERVPGCGFVIVVLLAGQPVLWRCSKRAGLWHNRDAYMIAARAAAARLVA